VFKQSIHSSRTGSWVTWFLDNQPFQKNFNQRIPIWRPTACNEEIETRSLVKIINKQFTQHCRFKIANNLNGWSHRRSLFRSECCNGDEQGGNQLWYFWGGAKWLQLFYLITEIIFGVFIMFVKISGGPFARSPYPACGPGGGSMAVPRVDRFLAPNH